MIEPVILHAEDRHRMIRLYEEVLTRLEEMAMITGRTLCLDPETLFEVRFSRLNVAGNGESDAVELVRGMVASGCYDYRRGVCFHGDSLRIIQPAQQKEQ